MTRTTAQMIAINDILPSPRNIRTRLTNLEPLAASIRSVGVLQTCLVRPAPGGKFHLVEGHRRRAAALKAGKTHLPCMVRHEDQADEVALMTVANLQRENLDPIDAARAFSNLLERFTLTEVVAMTGFSAATIRARIGLLLLPDEAQDMVSEGTLTLGAAADLVKSVKERRTGSALTAPKPGGRRQVVPFFDTNHRLADLVRTRCTHADSSRRLYGPGCGQCWEATIRDDALGNLDNVTVLAPEAKPFDAAVVERAVSGDHAGLDLTTGDREEVVRRLVARGLSDAQIAQYALCDPRTVMRTRHRLGIEPAIEPSRPEQRRRGTG